MEGDWIPPLPERGWMDVLGESPDGKRIALARWDIDESNRPGFSIVTIDLDRQTVIEGPRQIGVCTDIVWEVDGFVPSVFRSL
jgi:hypothetical protein